jgi:hypothetical protein
VITTVAEPTIESAQAMMAHPKTRILVVTGGPGVVQAALASKKKVIAGGPGNPPVVVDETADIANAARSIVAGASLDNNVICTDEKEVFVVDKVADALLTALARSGAYVIQPFQLQQLERAVLPRTTGPRAVSLTNKKFVGKDASVILKELGVSAGPEVRLIVAETPPDHRSSGPSCSCPSCRSRASRAPTRAWTGPCSPSTGSATPPASTRRTSSGSRRWRA